jgi:hypothetical protein
LILHSHPTRLHYLARKNAFSPGEHAKIHKEKNHMPTPVETVFALQLAPTQKLVLLSLLYAYENKAARNEPPRFEGPPPTANYVSQLTGLSSFVTAKVLNDFAAKGLVLTITAPNRPTMFIPYAQALRDLLLEQNKS